MAEQIARRENARTGNSNVDGEGGAPLNLGATLGPGLARAGNAEYSAQLLTEVRTVSLGCR